MKQMYKTKRRYITLIEIMVVMFLIALIMGALAYNFTGAQDEGRAFKTRAGIEKLESILGIGTANNPQLLDDLDSKWKDLVRKSPIIKNPENLIKDGWGNDYEVSVENGRITITSERFEQYKKDNPSSVSSGGK